MVSITWYLILQRTFIPFTIPSRASFSRQFLLSQWPSQFHFLLSVPAVFFLHPLFLAQLHFLFSLCILHAPSFSISTSKMLPVVFAHSVVASKSLRPLFLMKASFAIAILCFTSWQQFMLLLILKLSTCSTDSSLIRMSIFFGFLPIKSTPVVQWISYSPLDPRFDGFKPGQGRWFFQSVKILSMTSFGREVKPWVPCRRFTARKRTSSWN